MASTTTASDASERMACTSGSRSGTRSTARRSPVSSPSAFCARTAASARYCIPGSHSPKLPAAPALVRSTVLGPPAGGGVRDRTRHRPAVVGPGAGSHRLLRGQQPRLGPARVRRRRRYAVRPRLRHRSDRARPPGAGHGVRRATAPSLRRSPSSRTTARGRKPTGNVIVHL